MSFPTPSIQIPINSPFLVPTFPATNVHDPLCKLSRATWRRPTANNSHLLSLSLSLASISPSLSCSHSKRKLIKGKGRKEKRGMMADEGRGAPHGVLLAVVVGVVVAAPFLVGDGGEALSGFISDLVSPAGLLLLPVTLILVIRFLSSDRGTAFSDIFSFGSPDSIHRVGGSPIGVALVLLLLLFLLYHRVSFFGGGGDGDSGE